MSGIALESVTREIVVDELFPHAAVVLWKTLITPELMGRWLMVPTGFEPVVGNRFTYRTTPAGGWDGVIHCEVLEVIPNERLAYRWQGGSADNDEYGSPLDTIVTWALTREDGGTRLRLVHSGFHSPLNDFAFRNMSNGWPKVVGRIGELANEEN